MKRILVYAILSGLLSASPAFSMERFEILTTQELKQMIDDRASGKADFLLVNSLDEIIYQNASIPGSVNIPWSRIDQTRHRLGEDKDKLIVVYWMGYRWVFAYKTAVAVKNLGFTNIKIYNGGLKDWKKSGYELESIDPLPEYKGPYLSADALLEKIRESESSDCRDSNGDPLLTILDYRTENFLDTGRSLPAIKTTCKTVRCLLDDLIDPDVRRQIPRKGLVVLLCETGNRDEITMRYLYKYGYANVAGLEFGMRGWIKSNYPVDIDN